LSTMALSACGRGVAVVLAWATAISLAVIGGQNVPAVADASDPSAIAVVASASDCLPVERGGSSTLTTTPTTTSTTPAGSWSPAETPNWGTTTWEPSTTTTPTTTTTTTATTDTTTTTTTTTTDTPTTTTPSTSTPTTSEPFRTPITVTTFVQPAASESTCGSEFNVIPWVAIPLVVLAVLLAGLFFRAKRKRGVPWVHEHVTVTARPGAAATAETRADNGRDCDHAFTVVATEVDRSTAVEENPS
jgi:hypothetical protein